MFGVQRFVRFSSSPRAFDSSLFDIPGSPLLHTAIALLAIVSCSAACANAQVNVTTYHNDIGRTGQNLNETILNTSNVNATQFGKLFSLPVDGQVYAEPLYMFGVTINGATHNVVYVATENDSVYAFDADSNGGANASPLWQASMLSSTHGAAAGATTIPSSDVGTDIDPQIGITGTPVIDPATGTLYVVSAALEGGNSVQRLHALDITTGAEKFGGPVVITASVPGTGNGSVNGTLTFDSLWENQRPGLLLLNGIVWIGFAAHGDNGPWHGWILGYNAGTLQQTGAFCSSPNAGGAGFWMSGQGLAADQLDTVNHPYGRMFVPTGNGVYDAVKPYTNNMDYGDSHLNLDLTNGVPTVTDEFTTNQQAGLNSEDGDIASGGMMVIPTQTTGPYPHLAVQAGKMGYMYLINRDNMGGYNTTADQIVQEQPYIVGVNGAWSSPAYWNGTVYWWGRNDTLKAFPLANGLLSTTPSTSSVTLFYPGATPSVSANGTSQGIVWAIDSYGYASNSAAVLWAHNASNIATPLYSSSTNSARDTAGVAVKFVVPTIANGKVYVGTSTEVDVYGLLNGVTQTASPVITPGSESYANSVSVTITDSTPGASIYYTTDGTAASSSSTLYTGPITVTSTETINAIATATGFLTSAQTSATYTNVSQASVVVFSEPTGIYTTAQTVSLTDTTASASIYYTTDGSTPTTASTLYSGPITVSSTETITAIATAPGLSASQPLAQTYTINLGATGISFPQGFAASTGLVILNGYADLDDSRLQLTNGLAAEASSAWYYQPVSVQAFTSDFTFQLSNPSADGMTFAIQNSSAGTAAKGNNGLDLGYAPISNSIAIKFDLYSNSGEGPDSTGLYLNGAVPTLPAIDLSATSINLHSDDDMAVHLTYDGTTLSMTITDMVTAATWSTSWTINIPSTIGSNTAYVGFTGGTGGLTASQKILTWSYFTTAGAPAAATPTFSPAAGTYTSAQNVTISDTTAGAVIYYTTNGTTPTSTGSSTYSGPIAVSATETIKAIAVATGDANSAVGSAAYTITLPAAATPTFSPVAGTYTSAQTVTIADTTTGAVIYYTTNGTTPTSTSSNVYSGPITVSATETIKAIAVATGFTNSAVGSAAYTISTTAATPTFSPAAGTYTSSQTVAIADTTAGAVIYYTTNGTTPTSTSSNVYSGPITVSATETLKAIAVATGFTNSAVGSAAYTINLPAAATPTFSPVAGTYISTQTVTIADTTTGAVIYYTINGTTPTSTTSSVYSGPITVSATETLKAIAVATGFSNSAVGSAAYTINLPAATPTFSVAAGTYTSVQTVTISDATAGATIYYTINGTTPTTASTAYASAITVSATETLKAIAVATGSSTSAVASAAYTINLPAAATPTFSPVAGTYTSAQTVTIADTTTGAVIYYTTNGTTPTSTSSSVYSGPITVSATETLKAIAVAPGFSNSAVGSAAYTISTTAATPTFSPAAGAYTSAQTVTISDSTAGAAIYYTTNGTTPTTSSTVYSGPVTVGATETLNAIAVATGLTNSAVGSAAYTINLPAAATPTFSPVAGTYTSAQTVTIADTTTGAVIYYTTNGAAPTTSSTVYSGAITVSATETLKAIAVATGFSTSAAGSAAYTINLPAATPTFSVAAGTYTSVQTVTISDTTAGATIYYTTNGATPTTASTLYSSAITVSATETLKAIAVATGSSTSAVGSAAYTINLPAAATPAFSPVAGTYSNAQTVTISDTTAGATIYYTTNGTTPTTASIHYSTAITVSATETLKAIAVATGSSTSADGSAAYTINPPAATPTFLPVAGTYATAQTVTIGDTTSGATIYYTTNGAAPTTSSAVYSGAITVSATETLNAIAIATGSSTSAVGSAAYSISPQTPAPTFSLPAGTYSYQPVITLTDSTAGATIYYTTNGTTPTTSSTVYSGPITITSAATIKAIAIASGLSASTVASASYTLVAAVPVASPAGGSYSGSVSVTLTTATPGASIYYTTNGNTNSPLLYSGPIVVTANEPIQAASAATGFTTSVIVTNTYTILPTAAIPTFSPVSGSYASAQTVTISDATSGAAIYYTTNGTTPTTASAVYSGPITVSATETLKAIAVATSLSNSSVGTSPYTISTATPTVNFASGFTAANLNLYGATIANGALQLTDGGMGENYLAWYLKPVNVQAFTTDFNFQDTSATADGFTFVLQNSPNGVWALGANGGNLGYAGIGSSVAIKFDLYNDAGEGTDSTGFYVNGAAPTVPSVDMTTSGVNLRSGDILHAHVTYDGTTLVLTLTDTVTGANFTTSTPINIPSTVGGNTAYVGFTASTGAYTAVQKILNWTYAVN